MSKKVKDKVEVEVIDEVLEEETLEEVDTTEESNEVEVEVIEESKLAKVGKFMKKRVLPAVGVAAGVLLVYGIGYILGGKNSSESYGYLGDSSDDDDYMKYLEDSSSSLEESTILDADYTEVEGTVEDVE